MIALDTNLLVYAHRSDSPFHGPAKELLESLRRQPSPWAIPWPCLHEFVAVVTHPKVFKTPTPIEACFACIDAWHAGDNLHLIGESDGYLGKLHRIATAAQLRGPLIHDARVAAICLHHGVGELWSADRDFSAFPQLKVRNPLVKR
jgi:toxin-antitoxin system PIN domain toxin